MRTAEAAQKAVEELDKKDLDGRQVIVEIAKPAEQKDQEKKEKKAKRKPGRRGSKAVPGEVTEAEANGEAKPEGAAPSTEDVAKPKKKKKNNVSRHFRIFIISTSFSCLILSARTRRLLLLPLKEKRLPLILHRQPMPKLPRNAPRSLGHLVFSVLRARTPLASHLRPCFSLLTSVSTLTMLP